MMSAEIRQTPFETIIDLRARVLRPGLPIETAYFEEDHEPSTHHLAAYCDEKVVSCVSLVISPSGDEPAWRLRGMATDEGYQRRGIGTRLLQKLEQLALESPGPNLVWCTSRIAVIPFYKKQGWQVASDSFEIPGVGPHKKMLKRLG
jgi:GNAT superfamily N-acetyltransferase